MKKILQINVFMMILFSSILVFYNFKNKDELYWMNWGENANSQTIYLRNTGFSGSDLYILLTTLAEEVNVNLVKTDYLVIDSEETTIKSIYLVDEQDELFQDDVMVEGIALTKQDNLTNKFISSKLNNDENCVGTLFDFLDDQSIQIWTLTKFSNERGSLDGDYIIRSSNLENINSFIEELSERSGISKETLTQKTTAMAVEESVFVMISKIGLGICLFTFALVSLYYALNSSKKIGVMKMNGYNNHTIWRELTMSIFIMVGIFTTIFDILCFMILHNINASFMISIITIQSIVLLVLLVTSSLIYFIIKRNTVGNLVKNKQSVHHIVWMTYLLKSVSVCVFGVITIFIGYSLDEIKEQYDKIASWEDVSDYAVLVNVEVGNDYASIAQGDMKLDEDFAEYYDVLDDQGAIYTNVGEFYPHVQFKTKYDESTNTYDYVDYFDPTIVDESFTTTTFKVNLNYLKEFPLYDLNNEKITVEDTTVRTILIPASRQSEQQQIEAVYKAAYIDEIKAVDRRQGIETDDEVEVEIVSIIYQDDENGYFTFSDTYSDTNYKVYAPIFEVLTQQNMTFFEKSNIRVSGLSSPLKLKLSMSSNAYNTSIQEQLATYDLADNNLKYMTIGEVFATEINSLKNVYRQFCIALGITGIVIVFMIIHLTKLQIEAKKKAYCVGRLYGITFTDRYKVLFGIGICINIVALVVALCIGPQLMTSHVTSLALAILVVYIFLDMMVYILCIRFFENKSVTALVKGE